MKTNAVHMLAALIGVSGVALADTATITVPADQDKTLDEAIAAGYMTGVADYAGLLAASDLVVNGAGRLIIDKDLNTDGYAGEVHVAAGSTLRLTTSGALGDTAHGTFVADGATLETWTDGAANTLGFKGEPLSFAGAGVDGEGALVSLTTANEQRYGAWGGTVLTMTGDAMVRLKGARSNIDFPYNSLSTSSIDMNGHTLTLCGPGGKNYYTVPVRLNVSNPGHIVASNKMYVSMNYNNYLRGTTNNTFTLDRDSRLDFFQCTNSGVKAWTLIVKGEAERNAMLSSSGGGWWDGPVRWLGSGADILYAVKSSSTTRNTTTFAGPYTTDRGLDITNTTADANYPKPVVAFTGRGNRIGGRLRATDVTVKFEELNPSIGALNLVNAKMTFNRYVISGLWKGTNQAYISWNNTSAPEETRCRMDFMNNYYPSAKIPSEWTYYTNAIAYGPDVAMEATKPMYGKTTLVTYSGYLWNNTGKTQRITFLTHVSAYFRIAILREDGTTWNGPSRTDVNASGGPTAVLLTPGPHRIAMAFALHDGKGGVNSALSGDYGIMYYMGDSASTSTDPADYQPFMDPGDGSLLTRFIPDTDEYDELGIFGAEPAELTSSVTGYGDSTLSLCGGNYSVGSVTGALTVVNAAMPHTANVAFTVKDELVCRAADLLAGEHLVVTGALKFAQESILSVTDPKTLPQSGTYVVAESTEAITGAPSGDPSLRRTNMRVYVSPSDSKKLMADISVKGLVMAIR